MKRCSWAKDDPLYIKYHDEEWGVPCREDKKIFELLILEGMQAGLSWITILRKRENFRKAFDDFDPIKMARFSDKKIAALMQDPGIIRNQRKIISAKQNAIAYLKLKEEFAQFSDYIWSFVENKPIQNQWKSLSRVPASTKVSDALSKDLKKRGFSFIGTTICYAFMQAIGMVNDHVVECYRYKEVQKLK